MGLDVTAASPLTVICWVDGACDNNSKDKAMGLGALLVTTIAGKSTTLARLAKHGGINGTSNVAEYKALCLALEWVVDSMAKETTYKEIIVCMDSQLVLNQVKNKKRVSSPTLRPFNIEAQALISKVESKCKVTMHWVPRINNKEADELSKIGLTLA